jgi:membrane-associated phospholipid phosphatase
MKDRPKHELEALRAIDPRVAVEGGAVAPQAGDLAVASLVGGERRAEERRAQGDGKEPGEGDGGRWGPPRTGIDGGTAALAAVAFGIALLAQVLTFGLSLTPDRYVLVLLAPALVLGRGRRFLLDFVPFVVLIVVYEECRGIAHTLHPHPYYAPQLDAEKALFFGHVPSVDLQDWLWTGSLHWYDQFLSAMTRVHFIVPPTLAFALWLKRRALFYRFAASERGLIPFLANPAGVQAATSPLPTDSGPVYRLVDGNPYAAVPSLHGGYSLLVFLFLATLAWRTRWRWWVIVPAAAYPIIQSIAVVYTGNHYVVDLLIGFCYAIAAVYGVHRFWRWRGWPE